MPYYRLYSINALGHIHKATEFECDSDEAAIERAEARGEGRRELWNLERLVWSHDGGPVVPLD